MGTHVVLPATPYWVRRNGEQPFVAGPNHVILSENGLRYRRIPLGGHAARSLVIAPSSGLLREIAEDVDPQLHDQDEIRFPAAHGPLPAGAYLLARNVLMLLLRADAADEGIVEESLFRVLHRSLRALTVIRNRGDRKARSGTIPAHTALVEDAKAVLSDRLEEPLGLEKLSRTVGGSPFHLTRVFQRLTGFTPHEYRDQFRLRTALERLEQPRVHLASLAADLGYSSHAHFTTRFRRVFGTQPSAVAAQLGGGWDGDPLR